MERPQSCVLVIFGASGDLTKRKLAPALFELYRQNLLPERFAMLGIGRTPFADDAFRVHIQESLTHFTERQPVDPAQCAVFSRSFSYLSIDTGNPADYAQVKARLEEITAERGITPNVVFYLSTPPNLYETIAESLARHGLHGGDGSGGWRRIIVEKPFGRDLASARHLNRVLQSHFHEEQIYRIDHYLGKETVQNILALRFSNGIFEPLWNRNYVDRIEITSVEHIGVENRGGYYEQAGALRDMVQNHLLQVLATITMEPPSTFTADAVRNETVKVLQALRPFSDSDVAAHAVRGQYTASTIAGKTITGYREETDVSPDSRVETYVALKAYVDNWRWGGVPMFIRTGKRMPTRVTEVVVYFKRTPHRLFMETDAGVACNQLVIRIQPDEGILLRFGMKVPGAGFQIQDVAMDFHYKDLVNTHLPAAYERLLLDCMLGDATLYARSDAVEAGWAFVTPIFAAWQNDPGIKIFGYPAGTWGPKESVNLLGGAAKDWRYPCKNLTNDGLYCEL